MVSSFRLGDIAKVRSERFTGESGADEGLPFPQFTISKLDFYYGRFQALHKVSLPIPTKRVTALIGPSGCGKSTFLRTLNRLNETVPNTRIDGLVLLGEENLFALSPTYLRRKVGMVFQRPNPFRTTIFDNVAWGPKIDRQLPRRAWNERVERSLRRAALWDEVKDRLHMPALSLSGGQQQRLCIARALAVEPEVLLLDEPCSALDPISTAQIEDLIFELKDSCTVVIVTHNMLQAARVANYVGFFLSGKLIEFDKAEKIFTNPSRHETEDYVTGRYG